MIKKILKYLLYVISSAAILASGLIIYLIWFQPPFYFPRPTGQYAVGVKDYHWIDVSRKETFSDDPVHPNRELMVKIWYPAQGLLPETPRTPYAPYLVDYLKQNKPIFWILGFSRPIFSYAKPGIDIASDQSQYPIIIFSHGYGGHRDGNTVQCEELASHGYIVVGISHPYESIFIQFPDGHVADATNEISYKEKKNFIERRKQADKNIKILISDVCFVLDQLEKLNANKESMFFRRVDQANIGMFGQSSGGGTTVQICRRDLRVKAGVNMDGSLFGKDAVKAFDKPFMFMLAGNTVKIFEPEFMARDDWKKFRISCPEEEKMVRERYICGIDKLTQEIGHDAYTFIFKDFGHPDFHDVALFKTASFIAKFLCNLGIMGDFGPGAVDGARAIEIVNAYLMNFFDKYLKGKPSELLDGNSKQYKEVDTLKQLKGTVRHDF